MVRASRLSSTLSSQTMTQILMQGGGRMGCGVPGAGGLFGTQADSDRGAARHPACPHGVCCSGGCLAPSQPSDF